MGCVVQSTKKIILSHAFLLFHWASVYFNEKKKEKEQLDINFKIPELICVFVEKDLPN